MASEARASSTDVGLDQDDRARHVPAAPHRAVDSSAIVHASPLGFGLEEFGRELFGREFVGVALEQRDELCHDLSKLLRMAFESLAAFVRALRDAGELATIDAEVDPHLEIAEITDRVVKAGGPALLFRNVRGSRFPGADQRRSAPSGALRWRSASRSLAEVEDAAAARRSTSRCPPTLRRQSRAAGRSRRGRRVGDAAPRQRRTGRSRS